jgi:putative endonuclease
MYSVYILYSQSADRYYVGHTSDIAARLKSHNCQDGFSCEGKFTRKNGPWSIAYLEEGFQTRSDAMMREREIKRWKSRRKIMDLINTSRQSPALRD